MDGDETVDASTQTDPPVVTEDVSIETIPKPQETDKGDAKPEDDPKPGTPDKALQKVQQDTATALRLLEQLNAKKDAGESLTTKEARKLDKVKAFLSDKDSLSSEETTRDLAESQVETDDRVSRLEKELAEERRSNAEARESLWYTQQQAAYPGVDVKAVLSKAWTDAKETLGDDVDGRIVSRLATKLFGERAAAAAKRVTASGVTTASTTVKTGTAKTTVKDASSISSKEPLSPEQEMMKDIYTNVIKVE